MSDVYYEPEHFGLEKVGEYDFSSGSYEFDVRCIWREKSTGKLLTARDSGCSCPLPFEDYTSLATLEDFSESFLVEEARRDGGSADWIMEIRRLGIEVTQ